MAYIKSAAMTGSLGDFYADKPEDYQALKRLSDAGKTIDGFDPEHGYLVKSIEEIDFGYQREGKLHYKLEAPADTFDYLPNKLVVRFAPHGTENFVTAKERYAGNLEFDSLSKSIAKNTYILRIADVNLISGSYYLPTHHYPDYDTEILRLIAKICEQYDISKDRVICLGTSRGGTAALYYAAKGGYSAVVGDPIISFEQMKVTNQDAGLIYDYLPMNLAPIINAEESNIKRKKVIYSNEELYEYRTFSGLTLQRLKLINLKKWHFQYANRDFRHGSFINRTVPLQLALLNQMLYEFDLDSYDIQEPFSEEVSSRFDVGRPVSIQYVDVADSADKIVCHYHTQTGNFWMPMALNEQMTVGKRYRLEVDVNLAEIRFFFQHLTGKIQRPNLLETTEQADGSFTQIYDIRCLHPFNTVFFSAMSLPFGQTLELSRFKIIQL
jgi:hypothetical protein